MQEFTESLYKQLAAYSDSPEERCAFILDDSVIYVDNISETPEFTFMIKSKDFLRYKKTLKYIFHSHPSGGGPSPEDYLVCTRINVPMVVYSLPDKIFYFIKPKDAACLQYDYTDI